MQKPAEKKIIEWCDILSTESTKLSYLLKYRLRRFTDIYHLIKFKNDCTCERLCSVLCYKIHMHALHNGSVWIRQLCWNHYRTYPALVLDFTMYHIAYTLYCTINCKCPLRVNCIPVQHHLLNEWSELLCCAHSLSSLWSIFLLYERRYWLYWITFECIV